MSSSNIVTDYLVGIKSEVIGALQGVFGDTYPDPLLRNRVHVTVDYPLAQDRYPAILITYSEGPIRNAGVGHYEIVQDNEGNNLKVDHWYFTGQLNFNIMATTTLERDNLAAGFINLIAFGKEVPEFQNFYKEIEDADYVRMSLLNHRITPNGEQNNPTPWKSEDELLYLRGYTIPVFGEFLSEPQSGQLMQITKYNIYAYKAGDTIPTGTADPAPWIGTT